MRWLRLLACVLALTAFSGLAEAKKSSSGGSHTVRGHYTKNGKYVKPHVRTNPNKSKSDNYSTRGNVNPSTGKKGKKPVDR